MNRVNEDQRTDGLNPIRGSLLKKLTRSRIEISIDKHFRLRHDSDQFISLLFYNFISFYVIK